MTLPHEEAAKKVHPEAHSFRPVHPKISSRLIGWVFKVRETDSTQTYYSWMTHQGDVSSDKHLSEYQMEKALRAYVRHLRRSPSGNISVRNTSDATAVNGGTVVTGISFTKENGS